jgi:hypothetical protein
VLKDILLVILSILIWQTEVTLLQFIGYTIALAGLVWYKLGLEQVREHAAILKRAVSEGRAVGVVVVAVATAISIGVVWYAFSGPERVDI